MIASAPEKLFTSTAQALDCWLEAAEKREKLPAKEYLEYLHSFGWDRRSALSYVKLADFIKEHLSGCLETLAKLDIRTLLKLPLPRYAPIVEAIKTTARTQKEVAQLIKQLPKKTRTGFQPTGEGGARMFALPPLHNESGKVVEKAAQLTGLSLQKLVEEACHLVTSIITGEDLTQTIARIQELAIKQAGEEENSEFRIQNSENSQLRIQNSETNLTPYGLSLQDAVQWTYAGETHASYLTQVEGENALLSVNDAIYSVPLASLKKIDLNTIKAEIGDRHKLSHPYQQLYINAVNAKQEWVTLQSLPDGDDTYQSQLKQYTRWLSCAVDNAKRNGIWLDWEELKHNQRLILVPGGEDLIAHVANTPRPKHKPAKTSFLEAFSSGVPDKPSLEQSLKDAHDWDEIAFLVGRNNKTLTQATDGWTIEEKQSLIAKLTIFLKNSFTCAIQEKELAWLHHAALAKALAKLEFEVEKQVCQFDKFIDYGTSNELWSFRTEGGETIVVPRQEVKIFRF
ncbi:hypothetical protein VF14_03335 [Nostoc linckia z18]|uniref:Uncharacterized protein n=2 Tax=Nostoc linckia TaxID=92942 RepID=A0A9Q5ZGL6_NOSLI|nr:hypothetical protein [Nostoc linckia]PHK42409.1 hypothetical protein VF12_03350 [Nostoc linckia z15]PHK46917.1 hypothetical protein VF13_07975 [Nostoc linckia z16]PHJ69179.1 hypothetical protein VF02_00805 [Nostoc linckia z1]PHJ73330.1 hypothetical protein VF05_01820 [Nostoc linckia z3]PHJ78677.1 hypothetical protein VF03_00805 [Nostoc linckia z2]